jgi:putative transposase
MDEEFMRYPFYGVIRMHQFLLRAGYSVNIKRVRRLCRLMGLEAIYPKPNLSKPMNETVKYPYLLRGKKITQCNQVWSTDITYIPMAKGFMYLTAVIDWYSRYVLAWDVSNSMDTEFCVNVLDRSLEKHKPEIFNTDQGSQYTSELFTQRLIDNNLKISRDGKGRALDNIFVERLWRSVKYEEVYLNAYEDGKSLRTNLTAYFEFYNHKRPHQSLNHKTPAEVYTKG